MQVMVLPVPPHNSLREVLVQLLTAVAAERIALSHLLRQEVEPASRSTQMVQEMEHMALALLTTGVVAVVAVQGQLVQTL